MTETSTTPSAPSPIVTIEPRTRVELFDAIADYMTAKVALEDIVRLILEASADGLITMRVKPLGVLDVTCPWCGAGYKEPCHIKGMPDKPLGAFGPHPRRWERVHELNGGRP